MESIIVAVITGGLSLIGVIFSNVASNKNIQTKIEVNQAVMDTKMEELTREVRSHNEFGRRIPVIEEQIKVINHRLADIERGQSK